MSDMHAAALVLVMAAGTWVLRFLPFWVFRGEPPKYVMYLGRVGILSFSLAFLTRRHGEEKIKYPDCELLIG